MKGETPQVSIVMPAFNAAKTIAESIQTVIDQSYMDWELLVINDGSSDQTGDIVSEYQQRDTRIRHIKLPRNGGLSNARNEGCKAATGSFISFLDSDDLWAKTKLETQVSFHAQNPEIEISHTDFHLFNESGFLKRPFKYLINLKKHKQGYIYPAICYRNPIGVLTVMAKSSLLRSVGFFDANLWTFEDQDLWIRIARKRKAFGYIPNVLAYYRLVPGSISNKTGKYKKAYKTFIAKLLATDALDKNLLFRYYYRYFGTVYFKSHQFKLSRLYFLKSIQLVRPDFISLTTVIYVIYGILSQSLQGMKSVFRSVK